MISIILQYTSSFDVEGYSSSWHFATQPLSSTTYRLFHASLSHRKLPVYPLWSSPSSPLDLRPCNTLCPSTALLFQVEYLSEVFHPRLANSAGDCIVNHSFVEYIDYIIYRDCDSPSVAHVYQSNIRWIHVLNVFIIRHLVYFAFLITFLILLARLCELYNYYINLNLNCNYTSLGLLFTIEYILFLFAY